MNMRALIEGLYIELTAGLTPYLGENETDTEKANQAIIDAEKAADPDFKKFHDKVAGRGKQRKSTYAQRIAASRSGVAVEPKEAVTRESLAQKARERRAEEKAKRESEKPAAKPDEAKPAEKPAARPRGKRLSVDEIKALAARTAPSDAEARLKADKEKADATAPRRAKTTPEEVADKLAAHKPKTPEEAKKAAGVKESPVPVTRWPKSYRRTDNYSRVIGRALSRTPEEQAAIDKLHGKK